MPRPTPTTARALRAIHDRRPIRIHPPELMTLLKGRLVTVDERGALTLTKRGHHALHTADTYAKNTKRIPQLATALTPAAHELAPAIETLSRDRSRTAIETHAQALATLASLARHVWTRDERTLLTHLSNNPEKLSTTAKRLGWEGQRAHKALHRILQHAKSALAHPA